MASDGLCFLCRVPAGPWAGKEEGDSGLGGSGGHGHPPKGK